jgi:Mg2+/Co2+ transporter CorB
VIHGRQHLAIVVDEYGRTACIVTLERVDERTVRVAGSLDGHRITRLLVSVEGDRRHAGAGSESRKTRDDESSGCR